MRLIQPSTSATPAVVAALTLEISTNASCISLWPARFKRDCIDHSATRIALDLDHIAVLHNYQAAVAIRASGEFVRQDKIPAFALGIWY